MELTLHFFILFLLNYSVGLNFLESLTNITDTSLCPTYGQIEHGSVSLLENMLGDDLSEQTVHIKCGIGYDLEGPPKISCMDGEWEQTVRPRCVARCDPPPYIPNAGRQVEGDRNDDGMYKKGALATYTCKKGYQLRPPESEYRVCEKGIWTGANASCVLTEKISGCKPPKDITNGYYVHEKSADVDGSFSIGQRLHFSCKSGYILIGPPVQQCLEDGTWSPKLPPVCLSGTTGLSSGINWAASFTSYDAVEFLVKMLYKVIH